jgi:uncharacterized protein (UPF0332 family)
MNRELILAEWRRAQQAFRAAEVLISEDCYTDAVSRTYYAVLHAAKAALYAHGVTAETHGGIRGMFGLHLIKTGEIEKDFAVHLGQSFDNRFAADYDPEVAFSPKEARQEFRQTRQFLTRIRRFLLASGFTTGELRSKIRRTR